MSTIAITAGEPAGIGPDLCVLLHGDAAWRGTMSAHRLVVLGDRDVIAARAAAQGVNIEALHIEHIPVNAPVTAGTLNRDNSRHVIALLDRAIAGCQSGEFDAVVTAPVHKGIINDAGISFTGHTEYFAAQTRTPHVVMMLAGGNPPLRVALATTHLALKDVPAAITRDSLAATLTVLHRELTQKFGFGNPRVLVCGLNPHAGESGHLGREEIEVIAPTLDALRKTGMTLIGPLPADTLFTPRHLAHADAVLAMYHDQGLAVLKYASFGEGVNVTLGLPIIRTSVDHGTALDLAGKPGIETGSMMAAIRMAAELAQHRVRAQGT
jgi:4-hydroxythreonine-4-phosphate dehydrogenase